MRFVVTGAGGFLGCSVVRVLLNQTGHDVLAVSSQPAFAVSSRLGIAPDDTTRLELISPTALLEGSVLRRNDVVINCAFPWNRDGIAMATGLEFSVGLFRCAATAEVRTFVNVSSQSVYSQARIGPAHERSAIDCDSTYSTAKYAMELAAGAIFPPGILVNARMSSLIGVGYDIRIVNRFVRRLLRGEALSINGGDQVFDYMDVEDAARALVRIGERGAMADANAVNVGGSAPMSLRQIATIVADVVGAETGIEGEIIWADSEGDARVLTLDCGLLHSEYGFAAQVSFAESVRRIIHAVQVEESAAEAARRRC